MCSFVQKNEASACESYLDVQGVATDLFNPKKVFKNVDFPKSGHH